MKNLLKKYSSHISTTISITALIVAIASFFNEKESIDISRVEIEPTFYVENYVIAPKDKYTSEILSITFSGIRPYNIKTSVNSIVEVKASDYINNKNYLTDFKAQYYQPQMDHKINEDSLVSSYFKENNWVDFKIIHNQIQSKFKDLHIESIRKDIIKISYTNKFMENKNIYFLNRNRITEKEYNNLIKKYNSLPFILFEDFYFKDIISTIKKELK